MTVAPEPAETVAELALAGAAEVIDELVLWHAPAGQSFVLHSVCVVATAVVAAFGDEAAVHCACEAGTPLTTLAVPAGAIFTPVAEGAVLV